MSIVDTIRERRYNPRGGWARGRASTDTATPVLFDADDVNRVCAAIADADCPDAIAVMLAEAAVSDLKAGTAETPAEAAYLRDYARMVRLACRIAEWDQYVAHESTPRSPGHLPERVDAADIKARIDLVSYIDKHVRLVKAGHDRFIGICPFHDDHNPSMSVWTDGRWKCFACGAGGDVFSFVERWHKCDFAEAVQILTGGQ